MTIINQPKPNASPLVGENLFRLVNNASAPNGGLINDHFYWSNGHEYLSFIPHSHGGNGNWLIGVAAGEDSGYVYMEASSSASLTPIDNDFDKFTWKWLLNGGWVDQPDMRFICLDGDDENTDSSASKTAKSHRHSHFYEVEYFDPRDKQPTDYHPLTGYLIPNIYPKQFIQAGFTVVPKLLPSSANLLHGLLDVKAKKIHIVTDIEVLSNHGALSFVHSEPESEGHKAVLVNVEHGTGLWRMTYRYLSSSSTSSTPASASSTKRVNGKISIAGQGKASTTKDAPTEREVTVELNTAQGFTSSVTGITIRAPTKEDLLHEKQSLISQLLADKVEVGDYIWTWYSPIYDGPDAAGEEEAVSELLLRCRSRIGERKYVFEYHLAHRMEVMRRTVLSSDIDLLVIDLDDDLNTESSLLLYGTLGHNTNEKIVSLHQFVYIGKDVIGFIMDYIDYKEGVLGGLSSCYMYHAAYSLPQQLLYANEILCVLVGAKPVTMVSEFCSTLRLLF